MYQQGSACVTNVEDGTQHGTLAASPWTCIQPGGIPKENSGVGTGQDFLLKNPSRLPCVYAGFPMEMKETVGRARIDAEMALVFLLPGKWLACRPPAPEY